MNTIWKTAILTGILFIALISKTWAKDIDKDVFAKSFVDIRGKELKLDKSKQQAFILIISPYCSQCVHQIISELKYEKDTVEIFFLSYQADLESKYSLRSEIDFLHDKYDGSANIYFYDSKVDIRKPLGIVFYDTPNVFIFRNGKLIYISHEEIFSKGKFDYQSIRQYFTKE